MMAARKVKISVSIDAGLLGMVDRLATSEGTTRSAVMERWLLQASRRARLARLEEETGAYYEALTAAEKEDDDAWAATSSRASRKLTIDEASSAQPSPPQSQRRRR